MLVIGQAISIALPMHKLTNERVVSVFPTLKFPILEFPIIDIPIFLIIPDS
jgi:hypothetical protein